MTESPDAWALDCVRQHVEPPAPVKPTNMKGWISAASLSPDKNAVLLLRVGGFAWCRPRVATFSAGCWWTNNSPMRDLYSCVDDFVWMELPELPD